MARLSAKVGLLHFPVGHHLGRGAERDDPSGIEAHHALRKAGQDLAKKLNVTPAPPANDTLPAAAQRASDTMNGMAVGVEWDKAYINGEVAVHQSVLALLQNAQGAASDTSLKALITKAIPTIEAHLKKAQDVQSKLNSAPAADSSKKKADSATSKKK